MNWTKEQQMLIDFVRKGEGHGIVNAVAGAGKTSTILEAAMGLSKQHKVLFCAFNKAIGFKLQQKLGNVPIEVKTLHALGYDLLKNHIGALSFCKEKYAKLVSTIVKEQKLRKKMCQVSFLTRSNFQGVYFEGFCEMLEKYQLLHEDGKTSSCFGIYKKLESLATEQALEHGIIDFCDMTFLPNHLDVYPENRYDVIFIDECQDLSAAQLEIALRYLSPNGRVIAVGDPQQSIYAFLGADTDSFWKIEERLPSPKYLSLSTCFRCADNILALAQHYRADMVGTNTRRGYVRAIRFDEVALVIKSGDLVVSRKKEVLQKLSNSLKKLQLKTSFIGAKVERNTVLLSTIHSAKGLEANRVFILDYDLLPLVHENMNGWEVEQEYNLVYVAITRAKHTLFLVNSS